MHVFSWLLRPDCIICAPEAIRALVCGVKKRLGVATGRPTGGEAIGSMIGIGCGGGIIGCGGGIGGCGGGIGGCGGGIIGCGGGIGGVITCSGVITGGGGVITGGGSGYI